MLVQMTFGGLFGYISAKKGLSQQAIRRVALKTAGNTLTYGGLAFIIAGVLSAIFPSLVTTGISTGIKVHNLVHIGLPFILVILSVAIIGIGTMLVKTHQEITKTRHKPTPI